MILCRASIRMAREGCPWAIITPVYQANELFPIFGGGLRPCGKGEQPSNDIDIICFSLNKEVNESERLNVKKTFSAEL